MKGLGIPTEAIARYNGQIERSKAIKRKIMGYTHMPTDEISPMLNGSERDRDLKKGFDILAYDKYEYDIQLLGKNLLLKVLDIEEKKGHLYMSGNTGSDVRKAMICGLGDDPELLDKFATGQIVFVSIDTRWTNYKDDNGVDFKLVWDTDIVGSYVSKDIRKELSKLIHVKAELKESSTTSPT